MFQGSTKQDELLYLQKIFLVLTGHKPLSEVVSGHWEESKEGRVKRADDPNEVANFLNKFGLKADVSKEEHSTRAIVSRERRLIDAFVNAQDKGDEAVVKQGLLFGFPETAVKAFADKKLLTSEEQEKILKQNKIPLNMPMFRMSKKHYKEELRTLKEWVEVLDRFSLS